MLRIKYMPIRNLLMKKHFHPGVLPIIWSIRGFRLPGKLPVLTRHLLQSGEPENLYLDFLLNMTHLPVSDMPADIIYLELPLLLLPVR